MFADAQPAAAPPTTRAPSLLPPSRRRHAATIKHSTFTSGMTNAGRTFGSALGPDGASLWIKADLQLGSTLLSPWVEWLRFVSDRYGTDQERGVFVTQSGELEHRQRIGADVQLPIAGIVLLTAGAFGERIGNAALVAGQTKYGAVSAPRSPSRGEACAPPSSWTVRSSEREARLLDELAHAMQEAVAGDAVDDAMVVRERQVHHLPHHDGVLAVQLAHHRPLDDLPHAQDPDLRLVDDRRPEEVALEPRVRDGERPARQLVAPSPSRCARAARLSSARASPRTLSSLALRITGTSSPFSVSTATPRFTSLRRMIDSSCTTALMRGNSPSACTVARHRPTRKLGALPAVSFARFHSPRSRARLVMSTSAVQGTCGEVAFE